MCFELYQMLTNTARGTPTKKYGQRRKTVIYAMLSVLGPKEGNTNIEPKTHPTSPAMVYKALRLFQPYKPWCAGELSTLVDFQIYLCFFRNQRSSIYPPYAPYMNADVRGDPSTLHIPPNATRPTHVPACFAAAARSSVFVGQIEPTSIPDTADALPHVAMVQIGIHVSYVCISAEACRQIRVLLVWRGVGCEEWRGSPNHAIRAQGGTMDGL